MTLLRPLKREDAPLMLEWMRDPGIMRFFQFDASSSTVETCEAFIDSSFTEEHRHYAVVDETDEYLGTISLKNIDKKNGNAEYAIVLRKQASGKGLGTLATEAILKVAYEELGLFKVYLNVLANNAAACRLYEKCGFVQEGRAIGHVMKDGEPADLIWYAHFNPKFGQPVEAGVRA